MAASACKRAMAMNVLRSCCDPPKHAEIPFHSRAPLLILSSRRSYASDCILELASSWQLCAS